MNAVHLLVYIARTAWILLKRVILVSSKLLTLLQTFSWLNQDPHKTKESCENSEKRNFVRAHSHWAICTVARVRWPPKVFDRLAGVKDAGYDVIINGIPHARGTLFIRNIKFLTLPNMEIVRSRWNVRGL